MSELFQLKSIKYNLRKGKPLFPTILKRHTMALAPKIWQLIPDTIKNSDSLDVFKRNIKLRIPTACPCKLCKTYIQHVGFV